MLQCYMLIPYNIFISSVSGHLYQALRLRSQWFL